MKTKFNNRMLPSDFLETWLLNNYLADFPEEKLLFENYYKSYILLLFEISFLNFSPFIKTGLY